MDYACFIYNFSSTKRELNFNRIQYQALRLSLGYRVSTPIRVLHAKACEPPLSIRAYHLACNFVLKVLAISDHPLYDILFNLNGLVNRSNKYGLRNKFYLINAFNDDYVKKNYIYNSEIMLPFNYNFNSVFYFPNIDTVSGKEVKKSNHPNISFNIKFKSALENNYNFYTDASKSGEGYYTGLAIYSSDWENDLILQYKLTSYTFIFTGEALAIKFAIQFILDNDLTPFIYTDSKIVLDSIISNPFCKNFSYLSLELKKLLHIASLKNMSINLIWIPSHCDMIGNETVDSLAKDASKVGILNRSPIPFTDLYYNVTINCSKRFSSFLTNFRPYTGLY